VLGSRGRYFAWRSAHTKRAARDRTRIRLVCVLVLALVGCASHANSRSTSSTPPTTTAHNTFGLRVVGIRAGVDAGMSMVVALHPTVDPVELKFSNPRDIQICPATIEGLVDLSVGRWPSVSGTICRRPALDGRISLPSTDGRTHVAFALVTARSQPVSVTIHYVAHDSFFELVPPAGPSQVDFAFVPHSLTVGISTVELPNYAPIANVSSELQQGTRDIMTARSCDFPSEVACVGDVTPGQRTSLRVIKRTNNRAGLFISWL
jgi:hypothetical protein